MFVDIAYTGCGSGCHYCYVESRCNPQQLADYYDLSIVCRKIFTYHKKWNNLIVSFCPNTEPFKSDDSCNRILYILQKLTTYNLPDKSIIIQISTKEVMNDTLLNQLEEFSRKIPIFINISLPLFDNNKTEPFAGNQNDRISNIYKIKKHENLKCGLYIKPVSIKTTEHVEKYIYAINRYHPDYVCLGVRFIQKSNPPCLSLYDIEIASNLFLSQDWLLQHLIFLLKKNTECSIVFSSICPIIKMLDAHCSLELWKYNSILCEECKLLERVERD